MDPEAKAMEKLLRGPIPFETERYPMTILAMQDAVLDMAEDDPIRVRVLAEIKEKALIKVVGEIWPLSYRDNLIVQAHLSEAREVSESEQLSPSAKREFMNSTVVRVQAQACFRLVGSEGKARVFTLEEVGNVDGGCLQAIHAAYIERFVLTEGDLPKGSAPRS